MTLTTRAKTSPKRNLCRVRELVRDEGGATAIEYALILAAIAAVITVIVIQLGTKVEALYSKANDNFPEP